MLEAEDVSAPVGIASQFQWVSALEKMDRGIEGEGASDTYKKRKLGWQRRRGWAAMQFHPTKEVQERNSVSLMALRPSEKATAIRTILDRR